MKGTFFNKPLEYQLFIEEESFEQGQILKGSLKLVDHSKSFQENLDIKISLVQIDLKKFKNKQENFLLNTIEEKIIKFDHNLNEEKFEFNIHEDCIITDSSSAPFIIIQNSKVLSEIIGHLQINILPHSDINKVLHLIQTFQRYQLKTIKNNKQGIDYKLIPPSANDTKNIEQLNLIARKTKESLNLNFNFKTKKVDFQTSTMSIKKSNEKFSLELFEKDYKLNNTLINQNFMQNKVEEIFNQVKDKTKLFTN